MHGPQMELMQDNEGPAGLSRALGRHRDFLGQVIRFGVTGVLNTSICLIILFVLRERFGVDEWIASFIGYAVATVHSFILSKYWTFAGQHKVRAHSQFVAFVILNAIGAVLFSTGVHLLEPVMGLRPGSLVSTAVVVVYNFIGSKLFVFRKVQA